jgi:hypothetical protein
LNEKSGCESIGSIRSFFWIVGGNYWSCLF